MLCAPVNDNFEELGFSVSEGLGLLVESPEFSDWNCFVLYKNALILSLLGARVDGFYSSIVLL